MQLWSEAWSHFGKRGAIAFPSLLNCYNHTQPNNLNEESMSTYSAALTQVLRLAPDEQLRLISELLVYVRHRFQSKPKRSILELEGLGKAIWDGIDAQEYVNEERNSWNG